VFDRWNETEELLLDVERRLSERVAEAAPVAPLSSRRSQGR